jgi:hypothetical protein
MGHLDGAAEPAANRSLVQAITQAWLNQPGSATLNIDPSIALCAYNDHTATHHGVLCPGAQKVILGHTFLGDPHHAIINSKCNTPGIL